MLDFSVVRLQEPLSDPRHLRHLNLYVVGLPTDFVVPSGARQQCQQSDTVTRCALGPATAVSPPASRHEPQPVDSYLAAELAIPTNHPRIKALAEQIAAADNEDVIADMVTWINRHIEPVPQDSFSALDVLERRKAECQGQSYLLAALARARQIPAKVVNGLVYSETVEGFAYHTWVEVWQQQEWQPVDPTLGQRYADATHIKLLEGAGLEQLAPLLNIIGRIEIVVEPGNNENSEFGIQFE